MRKPAAACMAAMFIVGLMPGLAQQKTAGNVSSPTATPIKHLVVIFDENISFDHYFATYPRALNPVGEPAFTTAADTPYSNGLDAGMLVRNPNPAQPFRLDRSQALTCDNDNHYTDEQTAYHAGMIDKVATTLSGTGTGCTPNLAMGYYD